MYQDSLDIHASDTGSRLLSLESPTFPSDTSSSRTGPGDNDLSLSELSLAEQTAIMSKPFSLLAKFESDVSTPTRSGAHATADGGDVDAHNDEGDVSIEVSDEEARLQASRLREEKLQSDVFILKKLNASFELFNDALRETGSANERVAAQLEQTDALLNKYINILSQSEEFSRLIFNERWQGAEADEMAFEQEQLFAKEAVRREAEDRALREQQEKMRLEKEKEERLRREEKERLEREKSDRAIRGSIRGTVVPSSTSQI
ncbi:hypothetical protein NLJ89_g868 [Agrocybe chaxingu]|uniref:DASH complex subunit DUO1 n=1 Tax=Agrocybe chaxingu TaxID=84603 RepID=A0A9W8N169_9AGAR|nr:hypothetical protein NLJ89_g868 [Agrocybe chaxingu]